MRPNVSDSVQRALKDVASMSQWERAELGRRLRQHGWTHTEIGTIIPAAKSTIAGWCRDIVITEYQANAIRARSGSQRGIPRDTQRRRRRQRAENLERAMEEAPHRSTDPSWVAGVMLYWGEGFKTENRLGLANSDVVLVRMFVRWSRRYHCSEIAFTAKLKPHGGNDEADALKFWSDALPLPLSAFGKTFIKPYGTGHRRNHLTYGAIQVRARKSTDYFLRTTGWIEGLRNVWISAAGHD